MSYKSDFENDANWSVVDTNINLNSPRGRKFREFLRLSGADTIIRYYASSERPKTLTPSEAKLLSSEGFNLLPVYQDNNRKPSDFGRDNGKRAAANTLEFARRIGQPEKSTILFAVDADLDETALNQYVVPYFQALKAEIGDFRLGAYGGGMVLRRLMREGLIEVPWISMSRSFRGTQDFFYSPDWFMRQVPPDRTHPESGVTYDRNIISRPIEKLGAFRLDENGHGYVVGTENVEEDAVLGGVPEAAVAAPVFGTLYVSTDGLNLRERPSGAIIKELSIGRELMDLGPAEVADWRRVRVDDQEGVVFGKYVRQPEVGQVETLLQSAFKEWIRFDKGRANEATDPFYTYVGQMWRSIGLQYDGRSRYADGTEVPWSAAFISYVVRNAGEVYRNFKFADAHSVFAHDAIQARFQSLGDKPFWGYQRNERAPALGDIILRNRGRSNFSFDYAENHSRYFSHSDIVVEVTPNVVRVMGGNVSDTVTMRSFDHGDNIQEYELDSEGYVKDGQRVIAVLKNRTAEVG